MTSFEITLVLAVAVWSFPTQQAEYGAAYVYSHRLQQGMTWHIYLAFVSFSSRLFSLVTQLQLTASFYTLFFSFFQVFRLHSAC